MGNRSPQSPQTTSQWGPRRVSAIEPLDTSNGMSTPSKHQVCPTSTATVNKMNVSTVRRDRTRTERNERRFSHMRTNREPELRRPVSPPRLQLPSLPPMKIALGDDAVGETGTANCFTSSGTTYSRPSTSAAAWLAR